MAPMSEEKAAGYSTTAKPKRSRSSSRRRKITAELEARQCNSKETWDLQQQLLVPEVNEVLMEAAKKFLAPEHYQDIVMERALEGHCGYPPCKNSALALPKGKRWSVNVSAQQVLSADEVERFCSVECRRASSSFCNGLHPEPAYMRPASAVATTRQALSETQEAAKEKEALPKVRPRTVVRFSRESNTYSVQCSEYDGGGELPDVTSSKSNEPLAPVVSSKIELIKAPVLERPSSEGAEATTGAKKSEADATERRSVRFEEDAGPDLKEEVQEVNTAPEELPTDTDGESDGGDLFEHGAPPMGDRFKSEVPFVEAWGILSSWLTDNAKDVLRGAPGLRTSDERRPAHKGRRDLLCELLLARCPGDLSFMASRFYDLVSCLGVHQSLPSVTEHKIYDLLGALLLRGLLDAETGRGACEADEFQKRSIAHQVKVAAEALKISESEVQILSDMIR